MIIDARDCVLGRIASHAARKALLGENVYIVNSQDAVITGDKKFIIKKYFGKMSRGTPRKGPFILRKPHMIMKRTIRGMLPYKKPRGREALAKIRCYAGIPEELKNKRVEKVEDAQLSKLKSQKFIYLKELCMLIGGVKEK